MKNRIFRILALAAAFTLGIGSLSSCGSSLSSSGEANQAVVELVTNNNGTILINGSSLSQSVPLNQEITVTARPNESYYLDTLIVKGTDVTSSLSFVPVAAKNYIVSATFLKEADKSSYKVELSSDYFVEVGNTLQLKTTVYGPDKRVSYFCSDPDLARVDENGLVTTKKAGLVTVTANAVGSDISSPACASVGFFVAPHYIARMVDSMKGYQVNDGIALKGTISYCYNPSTGADPEESAMLFPYQLSIIKDEKTGLKIDFNVEINSTASFLKIILSYITTDTGLTAATAFGVTFLNDGYLYVYGKNDQGICFLKKLSMADSVVPFIYTQVSKLITSSESGEDSANTLISKEQMTALINGGYKSYGFATLATLLNMVFTFDEDPSVGIHAVKYHLATLQTMIDSLKEKALAALKKKLGEDSIAWFMASTIVPNLFPTRLTDASFTVKLKDDGSFDSFCFSIIDTKGVTESGATKSVKYTYLSIDYTKIAFTEDYLTNLETSLVLASAEQDKIAKATTLKNTLITDIKASPIIDKSKVSSTTAKPEKVYSIYDAINFGSSFVSDLTAYRDYVASLNDEASSNYVSNLSFKKSANLDEYVPYTGFKASLSSNLNNTLPDMYSPQVNDKIVLHSFSAVGDSTLTDPIDASAITFKMSDDKGKTVDSSIATFDSTTNTISILGTPTANTNLVITATSSYATLTYRLCLLAA
ncbi:MAG: Ig-like domain-containing protein [Bacilli bacterium]|jgi:hypothetical protein